MELLLFLFFSQCFHLAASECGWSVSYYQFSDVVCSNIQNHFEFKRDTELAQSILEESEFHIVSDFVYNPVFVLTKGNTWWGMHTKVEMLVEIGLESTFPEATSSFAGTSRMAALSGIEDWQGHENEIRSHCNGVKFTSSFGPNTPNTISDGPFSVSGDRKVSLDVMLATNHAHEGLVVTVNGDAVDRTDLGPRTTDKDRKREILSSTFAEDFTVQYHHTVSERLSTSHRDQSISLFFFTTAGLAAGAAVSSSLFVSPISLEANFENLPEVGSRSPEEMHDYFWGHEVFYSAALRFAGHYFDTGIANEMTGADSSRRTKSMDFNNMRDFDSVATQSSVWCDDALLQFFTPEQKGYLQVHDVRPSESVTTFGLNSDTVTFNVKSVGYAGPGKLTFYGRCAPKSTRTKFLNQETLDRPAPGDPYPVRGARAMSCSELHPKTILPITSEHRASVRCYNGSGCFKPVPEVMAHHLENCYGTVKFVKARSICEGQGFRLPTIAESAQCCATEGEGKCPSSRELFWTDDFETYTSNDDPFIIQSSREADPIQPQPSHATVKFYDAGGNEFPKNNNDLYETFTSGTEDVYMKVNYRTEKCSKCKALVLTFNYKNTEYEFTQNRVWRVSKHFGKYVIAWDYEDETRSPELRDQLRNSHVFYNWFQQTRQTVPPTYHGFAPFSTINYYAPADHSSPRFVYNSPTLHGDYVFYSLFWVDPANYAGGTADSVSCSYILRCERCMLFVSGHGDPNANRHVHSTPTPMYEGEVQVQILYLRFANEPTDFVLSFTCQTANGQLNGGREMIIPQTFITSGDSQKLSDECRSKMIINNDDFPSVCLKSKPKHEVVVKPSGPFTFSTCELRFNENNWNLPQPCLAVPIAKDFDASPCTFKCHSQDQDFDGDELSVEISDVVSKKRYTCAIGVAGAVLTWDNQFSQLDSSNLGDYYMMSSGNNDDINFHVQVRIERCYTGNNGVNCVTAVVFQYQKDIYAVYKEVGCERYSVVCIQDGGSDISVVDNQGCFVFTTPCGKQIMVCCIGDYLHVSIELSVIPSNDDDVAGVCSTKVRKCDGDSLLKYPFETIVPHNWEPLFPVRKVCTSEFNQSNFPALDRTRQGRNPIRNLPTKSNVTRPGFSCGDLSGFERANLNRAGLGNQNINDVCQLFSGLGTFEPINAMASLRNILWNYLVDYMSDRNGPQFQSLISLVTSSHRWCPYGTVNRRGGCIECRDIGCFGELVSYNTEVCVSPCTDDRSFVVDPRTGEAWKCFMGLCAYTRDGCTWEGLPSGPNTPYCLDSLDIYNGGRILYGFSSTGVSLASLDDGQTWLLNFAPDTDAKIGFQKLPANTNFFDNVSPAVRGNSHSPPLPEYSFPGKQNDIWWLTEQELCIQSSRWSGYSKICCSKWWCDCHDLETFGSAFGIQELES